MEWPGIAALSCAECKKHLYTIPEGKLETYEVGDGDRLPVLRDPELPPPCDRCPRGGPQNEERLRLSARGYAAFALYKKLKATHGAYRLHPKIATCPVFAENMRIVESTIEEARAANKLRAIEKAKQEHGDA